MKHVIVINTVDHMPTMTAKLKKEFHERCVAMVDCIAEHYFGQDCCFSQSKFFTTSAIAAVKEMYNVTD